MVGVECPATDLRVSNHGLAEPARVQRQCQALCSPGKLEGTRLTPWLLTTYEGCRGRIHCGPESEEPVQLCPPQFCGSTGAHKTPPSGAHGVTLLPGPRNRAAGPQSLL